MIRDEKVYLLQVLLQDMRGAFPGFGWGDGRMKKAKELADELGLEQHSERINELATDKDYGGDGRHFRACYEDGGYEGMEKFHSQGDTFHDKSEEFRKIVTCILEYPEYKFSDWKKE